MPTRNLPSPVLNCSSSVSCSASCIDHTGTVVVVAVIVVVAVVIAMVVAMTVVVAVVDLVKVEGADVVVALVAVLTTTKRLLKLCSYSDICK